MTAETDPLLLSVRKQREEAKKAARRVFFRLFQLVEAYSLLNATATTIRLLSSSWPENLKLKVCFCNLNFGALPARLRLYPNLFSSFTEKRKLLESHIFRNQNKSRQRLVALWVLLEASPAVAVVASRISLYRWANISEQGTLRSLGLLLHR